MASEKNVDAATKPRWAVGYNDPINKIDPTGLTPSDDDFDIPVWIAPYVENATASMATFYIPMRPSLGLVRINIFIGAPVVEADIDLPGPWNIEESFRGDGRSWNAWAPAQQSRGSFELDFRTGIARVFVNYTCSGNGSKCWDARPIRFTGSKLPPSSISTPVDNLIALDEKDGVYSIAWRLTNPALLEKPFYGFGCSIDGKVDIGYESGKGSFGFDVDRFPSVEAYQFGAGGPTTLFQSPESGNPQDLCASESFF